MVKPTFAYSQNKNGRAHRVYKRISHLHISPGLHAFMKQGDIYVYYFHHFKNKKVMADLKIRCL